jgi:hypothetical protein
VRLSRLYAADLHAPGVNAATWAIDGLVYLKGLGPGGPLPSDFLLLGSLGTGDTHMSAPGPIARSMPAAMQLLIVLDFRFLGKATSLSVLHRLN